MYKRVRAVVVAVLMLMSFVVIIIQTVPLVEAPTTWYVDDSNPGPGDGSLGNPFKTIQAGVDNATPGDTVFVLNGTYYEDVYINKTINLTGISRDNTTINCTSIGIWVFNVNYVNITGFTVENASAGGSGIAFTYSNSSLLYDCRVEKNGYGITISNCNNTIVRDNIASNTTTYDGIYMSGATNTTVKNNICVNNARAGIYVYDSSKDNFITNNTIKGNKYGIWVFLSDDNIIINNQINGSIEYGIWVVNSNTNTIENTSLYSNSNGIYVRAFSDNVLIINCTIKNSTIFDIGVDLNTQLTVINTTFNKSKAYFGDGISTVTVKWYLHLNVIDYLGNPVPNAKVKIEDNLNGSYNETFPTDINGQIKWLLIIEYIEQDQDGDTIGKKTSFTPHSIIAWNDTLVGYAYPEPNMNESKTITIVLYNATLMDLQSGWNLISLPRVQTDTNIVTVLQSIDGSYNSVWRYNITDYNDQWKLYHVLKPSYMNDLSRLNHTIGFWIHITDPEGTTLVVLGDELSAEQHISLHPGWNLVGFPSKSNKTRNVALDNINFGSDVDSIWTYNASTQKWVELDDVLDYFEVGQGYWLHSKVTKVWNVPL